MPIKGKIISRLLSHIKSSFIEKAIALQYKNGVQIANELPRCKQRGVSLDSGFRRNDD
jgi:hypothetical protein